MSLYENIKNSLKNSSSDIRDSSEIREDWKELSDGMKYLYRTVFFPLADDQMMTIAELDLNRFCAEDILALNRYLNENHRSFYSGNYSLGLIYKTIKNAVPVTQKINFV